MKIKLFLSTLVISVVIVLTLKSKQPDFPIIKNNPIDYYRSHFPNLKGQIAFFKENDAPILIQLESGKSLEKKDLHIRYPIGSISKQFTAAAVLSLQSQNKLNIQDPVCKYLATFCKGDFEQITIEHLLTHRSGLPRSSVFLLTRIYKALTSTRIEPSNLRATDFLKQHMPTFLSKKPGTHELYSNLGYIVLSALIEQITQAPFHESIKELVFKPNNLKETECLSPQQTNSILPQAFILQTSIFGNSQVNEIRPFENIGEFYGAGGCISTIHDLHQWSKILDVTPLQPFGWVVDSLHPHQPWFWHNGAIYGYQSQIHRIPTAKSTLIMLMNIEADGLSDQLARSILTSIVKSPD